MATRKPGIILVTIGWIFITISVVVLIGMLQLPRESLLNQPDSISIVYIIGFIIGANPLNLLALLFGIYATIKKNEQGKVLIIASVLLICITTGTQFLPSSESVIKSQSDSITMTEPQSEFIVTFPHPVKKVNVTAAGFESVAYESKEPDANPYLRAEFMNKTMTALIKSDFRTLLENQAKLSGLNLPQITESSDYLGKVGTYSGFKKVGDVTLRVYGKVVLGEYSSVNCMIVEELKVFPSEDSAEFLIGIERKESTNGDNGNKQQQTQIDAPASVKTFTNSIGMKLVYIPPGEFMMGSSRSVTQLAEEFYVEKWRRKLAVKEGWFTDQLPQHQVRISKGFWIGQTEVTQGQFKSIMNTEPWTKWSLFRQSSNNAASYISWDHAVEFCKKLSQAEGVTYRLPTEAEWEYACRANTRTLYSFGDNDSSLGEYAWFVYNASNIGEDYAHAVGHKKPNGFGLYDMHGNVREWCSDWFDEEYYSKSPLVDPQGPLSGESRVIRGGCYLYGSLDCRSAHREFKESYKRLSTIGFRVVRVQP